MRSNAVIYDDGRHYAKGEQSDGSHSHASSSFLQLAAVVGHQVVVSLASHHLDSALQLEGALVEHVAVV